jgi:hypothetical protein
MRQMPSVYHFTQNDVFKKKQPRFRQTSLKNAIFRKKKPYFLRKVTFLRKVF